MIERKLSNYVPKEICARILKVFDSDSGLDFLLFINRTVPEEKMQPVFEKWSQKNGHKTMEEYVGDVWLVIEQLADERCRILEKTFKGSSLKGMSG